MITGLKPGGSTFGGVRRSWRSVRSCPLGSVSQSLHEQSGDVAVGEAIHGAIAVTPKRDQCPVAEQSQLMTDSRLTDSAHLGEIADAELRGGQRVENAHARRIRQRREDARSRIHERRIGEACSHIRDSTDVHDRRRATPVDRSVPERFDSI